jgi:hypothetical protein
MDRTQFTTDNDHQVLQLIVVLSDEPFVHSALSFS